MDEHAADGDSGEHRAATVRPALIVDDSASVRAALRTTLEATPGVGRIFEAVDGVNALALLARESVDLIITDVQMPRLDGFKLLSAVRDNPRLRDAMVIMLSSRGEAVDKVRGLTIGANDYVTKPFEAVELQARVSMMLRMRDLQEELQRKAAALELANRELERLAHEDDLTGLPNRRLFFRRLEHELVRSRRMQKPLALLMIDIDHFKAFNDRYGHLAGDLALRAAGAALLAGIRAYDCAGRYGGEEFVTLLPETDADEALVVAERVRRQMSSLRLELPGQGAIAGALTVSIGVASWPEVSAERVEDILAAADRALYRAKDAGRDRCERCGPSAAADGGA
ncbi:MAG TPA: diguanylate cyclase [Candidatus Methanoperedens sp.]|nr:diguanylate cyclase [Candidatus Methanoperedens sp.]